MAVIDGMKERLSTEARVLDWRVPSWVILMRTGITEEMVGLVGTEGSLNRKRVSSLGEGKDQEI